MKKIMLIVSLAVLLLGCGAEIPNPIVGSYKLMEDGIDADKASLVLRKDSTFTYTEVIENDHIVTISGKYTLTMFSFNFLESDGSILFNIGKLPPEVEELDDFFFSTDRALLYDWKCDKNNGPQSLTLVVDPEIQSKNLEFTYFGSETKLEV